MIIGLDCANLDKKGLELVKDSIAAFKDDSLEFIFFYDGHFDGINIVNKDAFSYIAQDKLDALIYLGNRQECFFKASSSIKLLNGLSNIFFARNISGTSCSPITLSWGHSYSASDVVDCAYIGKILYDFLGLQDPQIKLLYELYGDGKCSKNQNISISKDFLLKHSDINFKGSVTAYNLPGIFYGDGDCDIVIADNLLEDVAFHTACGLSHYISKYKYHWLYKIINLFSSGKMAKHLNILDSNILIGLEKLILSSRADKDSIINSINLAKKLSGSFIDKLKRDIAKMKSNRYFNIDNL